MNIDRWQIGHDELTRALVIRCNVGVTGFDLVVGPGDIDAVLGGGARGSVLVPGGAASRPSDVTYWPAWLGPTETADAPAGDVVLIMPTAEVRAVPLDAAPQEVTL